MPVHNFMVQDLSGSLIAIALFPLFVLIPGYVLAGLLDLFDFRNRTSAFRLCLAAVLSIAICPILTYLAARFISLNAVWAFYAATALALPFLLVRRRERPRLPAGWGTFALVLAGWLLVCIFSLIDLQIGDRLYYPVINLDYSVRTAFVNSLTHTGIPPENPFFQAGHSAALRYHYFWLMMCSLVQRLGGGMVGPRHALIGGTFWVGAALIALLALYLRLFSRSESPLSGRLRTAVLLLAVTGLDILPTLFFLILYAAGIFGVVLPSVEWWNQQLAWFVFTTLWTPHAIAALVACFTSFLLIWHAPAAKRRLGILRYALPGAMGLASSFGASIWVMFVFGAFLLIWTAIALWKRWFRDVLALAIAGVAAAVLIFPYVRELSGPGLPGPLVALTVRSFFLADVLPAGGLNHTWRLILYNGSLLPLNYFLEFGFFLLAARYKWKLRRAANQPLQREELAFLVMAATSALICTFLRSTVGNNDLGWRGFLVAQFVLLLWAADLLAGLPHLHFPFLSSGQKGALAAMLFLGLAGTAYDLVILRLYPVLSDRRIVPPLGWMARDRKLGARTYAARMAYEWANSQTVPRAVVQANPDIILQDTLGMSYSARPTAAGDLACIAAFGGDPAECATVIARLRSVFPTAAAQAPPTLDAVCRNLPVEMVVAKDTDPVWRNRASWVWTQPAAYANRYIRVFNCPSAERVAAHR
jgi:hypothetical protein